MLAASWWADSKNIVNEATGCANDNKAFDSPPSKKMFSMFVSRCRSLFAACRYMCFAFSFSFLGRLSLLSGRAVRLG